MRFLAYALCFLLGSSALLFAQSPDRHAVLEIVIEGIENDRGQINYLVFPSEEGFPHDRQQAVVEGIAEATGPAIRIRVEDLPYGEYAVSILHDEDRNELMRTGIFGIPKEGYGFSNDAPLRFGPPHFSDAVFTVDDPTVEITIRMRYRL